MRYGNAAGMAPQSLYKLGILTNLSKCRGLFHPNFMNSFCTFRLNQKNNSFHFLFAILMIFSIRIIRIVTTKTANNEENFTNTSLKRGFCYTWVPIFQECNTSKQRWKPLVLKCRYNLRCPSLALHMRLQHGFNHSVAAVANEIVEKWD